MSNANLVSVIFFLLRSVARCLRVLLAHWEEEGEGESGLVPAEGSFFERTLYDSIGQQDSAEVSGRFHL